MRIAVLAVGRLGRGAEAGLVRGYVERATAIGRAIGLGPIVVGEVEGRKPGKAAEGEALLAALAAGDGVGLHVIACDERGEAETSRRFAERIGALRDRGVRRTAFMIGGADGLSEAVLARADHRLSFGPWTWPHALARVLLAEQLYRAATLLAGGPYHRD